MARIEIPLLAGAEPLSYSGRSHSRGVRCPGLRGIPAANCFWIGRANVRVFFPTSILFLWCVLAWAFLKDWNSSDTAQRGVRIWKLLGLAILLLVPFAIYFACNPAIYPAVNPDSGGLTAASQLESVLIIVAILFLLPYGVTKRPIKTPWLKTGWIIFAIEALLCLALDSGDVSHHRPTQYISLGSLLMWVPLMPAYYNAFVWRQNTRRWRLAVLA